MICSNMGTLIFVKRIMEHNVLYLPSTGDGRRTICLWDYFKIRPTHQLAFSRLEDKQTYVSQVFSINKNVFKKR